MSTVPQYLMTRVVKSIRKGRSCLEMSIAGRTHVFHPGRSSLVVQYGMIDLLHDSKRRSIADTAFGHLLDFSTPFIPHEFEQTLASTLPQSLQP